MRIIILISFISMFIFLLACNTNNKDNSKTNKDSELNQTDSDTKSESKYNLIYKKYNITLPTEIFIDLKFKKPEFRKELLNLTCNASKYQTHVIVSFNLGVYSADLAYCTIFERSQESVDYYNTSKKMADFLEISKGFDQSFLNRINANIENKDSLLLIAHESYGKACNSLERKNNLNILPFVVAGAWIESNYLLTNQIDFNKPEPELMIMVYNQRKALNNLIDYLYDVMIDSNAFKLNPEIKLLILKLNDLQKSYESIRETIKVEEYREITKKIEKIRNAYIK